MHTASWRRQSPRRALGAFPAVRQPREAGVRLHGCTVHFVTEGVDEGPIIIQAAVPVLDGDTPETLAARILEEEHRIFPRAVQLYAEGRLTVEGRRVRVTGTDPVKGSLTSP